MMYGHAGDSYGLISDLYGEAFANYGLIFITNGYKPDHAYVRGKRSGFFRPEEATFDVLGQYSRGKCKPIQEEIRDI